MKKKIYILLFPFLACSFSSYSQNKQVQKAMDKIYGKSEELTKEYKDAEALSLKAIEALRMGEVKQADALINESIKLYPTKAVFQYVKELCKMPDINKANSVMDNLYSSVKSFPESKILMQETLALTYVNGKMMKGIKLYEKERALFSCGYEAYLINKEFGGVSRTKRSISTLIELQIQNTTTGTKYDFEYNQLQMSRIELAVLDKDFEKALQLTENRPTSLYLNEETKKTIFAWIYQEKGDYEKALTIVETLKGNYKLAEYKSKFMLNALIGNNEKALRNYEKYIATQYAFKSNDLFYYLSLTDLNQKKYPEALANLDSTLNHKCAGTMEGMEVLFIDKWKVYKLMGDAYAGLKQFDKARDNYNISLLYYPEYQPAIDGLASLEMQYATETASDKTPPVISITEPSVKRGLKVTVSNNEVMIKGVAKDPSGIKTVSINGLPVYAQEGGDFWGNITLKPGVNTILVKATDKAGNSAEHTFEIQKQSAPAVNNNDIVPVAETEGKNYCLLVAAQNYSDRAIPSLENPIADAVKLKIILKSNYNFADGNIFTLFNPDANEIKRQLLELTNIIQPQDNLLIFYAGHGIWVEKEKKGYWLLTDAKRNDVNTWLPNKDVLNLIAKLPSRHTLLITDACFSGSVFKTRSLGKEASAVVKAMDEKISRVAITSGNDTEVPDESVFMKYLVKALSENKEKYLTAQKMFINQIIEAVMTETKTEPRYGTLEAAGHVGGDYIFTKK